MPCERKVGSDPGALHFILTVFVVASVGLLLLIAMSRRIGVLAGLVPGQAEDHEVAGS
jgi:hypothetical protein